MKYSKGICWIGDCRIPTSENLNGGGYGGNNMGTAVYALSDGRKTLPTNKLSKDDYEQPQGRFTPNLLVCDDMLNDGSVSKVQDNLKDTTKQYGGGNFGGGSVKNNFYFGDSGSSSRYYDLDKWFDKVIDSL
jgi:hypothetical protein